MPGLQEEKPLQQHPSETSDLTLIIIDEDPKTSLSPTSEASELPSPDENSNQQNSENEIAEFEEGIKLLHLFLIYELTVHQNEIPDVEKLLKMMEKVKQGISLFKEELQNLWDNEAFIRLSNNMLPRYFEILNNLSPEIKEKILPNNSLINNIDETTFASLISHKSIQPKIESIIKDYDETIKTLLSWQNFSEHNASTSTTIKIIKKIRGNKVISLRDLSKITQDPNLTSIIAKNLTTSLCSIYMSRLININGQPRPSLFNPKITPQQLFFKTHIDILKKVSRDQHINLDEWRSLYNLYRTIVNSHPSAIFTHQLWASFINHASDHYFDQKNLIDLGPFLTSDIQTQAKTIAEDFSTHIISIQKQAATQKTSALYKSAVEKTEQNTDYHDLTKTLDILCKIKEGKSLSIQENIHIRQKMIPILEKIAEGKNISAREFILLRDYMHPKIQTLIKNIYENIALITKPHKHFHN